jgi:hypothetical protein
VLWIFAHIGRIIVSGDKHMSKVATFVTLRFQTRQYFGVPFDYMAVDKHYPERVPGDAVKGKYCFGVTLYETLWYQHRTEPELPIPYILHCIVTLLKERGPLATQGFLRIQGDARLLKDILTHVNQDITTIWRGNVLKQFSTLSKNNDWRKIINLLPTLHRNTLFYLIGFLREVVASAKAIPLDPSDISTTFGQLIVNPARAGKKFPDLIQNLTDYSVACCARLLDP